MADVPERTELGDWVIEQRRSRYSIGYWVSFVVGMFGQMVPTPPDVTYTLRNAGSGEVRTFTLPGDHPRSALADALAGRSQAQRAT